MRNTSDKATSFNPDKPEVLTDDDAHDLIVHAGNLFLEGKQAESLKICVSLLKVPNLRIDNAAAAASLLRDLKQDQMADQVRAMVLDGIQSRQHAASDSVPELLVAARALAALEENDLARERTTRIRSLQPDDLNDIIKTCMVLERIGKPEDALGLAEDFLDRGNETFQNVMSIVFVFGQFEHQTDVKPLLARAEKRCASEKDRAVLHYQMAAHGMDVPGDLDQHNMALATFDSFAKSYDERLENLENNGPSLIYSALEELELPKTKTRRILDAGCGTGLCARFLRRYSKEITGVDISVPMLELARDKRVYDFIARTDLSNLTTFPEGRFDMIVCADVLVYFGALDTVLTNFQVSLNPGGWLILTVETLPEDDDVVGFRLQTSGRHKHTDAYMLRTLAAAGFPKPKIHKHARLRNEMGKPILGTAIAVQKPAFAAF